MKFDLDKAKSHIDRLAKQHKLRVIYRNQRRWEIEPRRRIIKIRPIKTSATYVDALFAIGHLLGPWRSKPRLFRVAGAWKWAKENAAFWTPHMTKIMEGNLLSFWAWQNQHKTAALPPSDHVFWDLLSDEVKTSFEQYLKVKEVMDA